MYEEVAALGDNREVLIEPKEMHDNMLNKTLHEHNILFVNEPPQSEENTSKIICKTFHVWWSTKKKRSEHMIDAIEDFIIDDCDRDLFSYMVPMVLMVLVFALRNGSQQLTLLMYLEINL